MKYTVAFITASLAVMTASKHKHTVKKIANNQSESDSIENLDATEERNWDDNGPIPFELKGTLKRAFAYEAALAGLIRNFVSSPLTAGLPLGKLVLGTDAGECRDELLKSLGYPKNKVKMRLRSVISKLRFIPGVTLSVASTIYISDKKHLTSKYHRDTMSVFKSGIQKLDYEVPENAAAVINKKVFDGTRGKFSEIISADNISPNTSLILVNIIYFTGRWKARFNEVKEEDFNSPDGATKVPMMNRKGNYYYYKSTILGSELIEVPYHSDMASFVIILPMVQNGLSLLLKQLKVAPDLLYQAVTKMRQHNVTLSMPKFKIASELDLKSLYQKLGVTRIFDQDQSNLTRITRDKEKVWVTAAKQMAYIEVNEHGTQAAPVAATGGSPAAPENQITFKADRPFLFFVKLDGDQLFAGIFTNQQPTKNVALENPSRNLIFSPISALLPLGKLVLGTEGGTSRDELLRTIGYRKSEIKNQMRYLIKKLKYLPGVTLSITSTVYVSKHTHLTTSYYRDTMSVFESSSQKLDFGRPVEAAAEINKKVSDSTRGRISHIVSPGDISPSTSVLLVNAVYFSGLWKKPFKDVKVGYFYSPNGMRKVPMMTRQGTYYYHNSEVLGAQIIDIPYEGDKASFLIILPASQDGLQLLLTQLKVAPMMLNQEITKMTEARVSLTIPKFRIESEFNLNSVYEKLGVRRIFLPKESGLTRMTRGKEKLFVSKAVQKAYIEVTEKGTEAAAVTAVDIVPVSKGNRVVFRADRPFLFLIKAEREQLFAGIFTSSA